MANTQARFKQCEVQRAIKGAHAAGVSISEIIVNETGVVIRIGEPATDDDTGERALEAMIDAASENKACQ